MFFLTAAIFFLAFTTEAWSGFAAAVHQCEYGGVQYEEGDSLPTRHLCLSCKCSPNFVEPNDLHCDVIDCPHAREKIAIGCMPTYNETECCPVSWNCEDVPKLECDQRYFKHYLAQGCEPVYGEGDESECPKRFKCPPQTSAPNTEGCKYRGQLFSFGQDVPTANPCQVCSCLPKWGEGGSLEIVCVGVECPSAFRAAPRLNDSCYEVYEKDKCCSTRTHCVDTSIVDLKAGPFISETEATCAHEGKTYHPGQRFYPEPCVECVCGPGWTGDVRTDPNCRQHDCTLERRLGELAAGCLPIYHQEACCPIEYDCGENFQNTSTPLATAEEIESGATCVFKGGHYRVGQLLDLGHPSQCVTCRCATPPAFTCVHRSCPPPPDGDSCVPSYKSGSCCPTYDCPTSAVADPVPIIQQMSPLPHQQVQCSPAKCMAGCTEVTIHNSCPFCKCGGETLCAPPKCDAPGCRLEPTREGPCPACKCPGGDTTALPRPSCSPVKCPANCHQVTPPTGCPMCVCGPVCSPPKCTPNCPLKRDVAPGECPYCACADTTGSDRISPLQCSPPVKCPEECTERAAVDGGCPTCDCPVCAPPKCDPGCRPVSVAAGKCPGCVCHQDSTSPQCSPVKCGPLCHEAYGGIDGGGCPTCICDPACSPPACAEGCHLEHDPSTGTCPQCVCGQPEEKRCPELRCGSSCHQRPGPDGCPTCECGPQCSAPRCADPGCHLEYDRTAGPCPACVCRGASFMEVQCSPPKCDAPCTIDYNTKPCPSCNCHGGPIALSGIMCSPPPKCEAGCRIDYSRQPCPSCTCDGGPSGLSGIMCSPPKCEAGCRVDYSAKPCPSCSCDGQPAGIPVIMCSPPKCEGGCRVDYSTKPCPSCSCDGGPVGLSGIMCSPPKCDAGCRVDYSTKPCPTCTCDGGSTGVSGIMCSPPKCEAGCRVDYTVKPCPACTCVRRSQTLSGIMCSPPKCEAGCRVDYSVKPCPSCKCDGSPIGLSGIMCSPPKCETGCRVDYSAKPCPSCTCDGGPSLGVSGIMCSPPKCEAGCRVDYSAKPCPSCVCDGGPVGLSGIMCSPPKCEAGCRVDYSAKPCPSCVCDGGPVDFSGIMCSLPKCEAGCTIDYSSKPCPSCSCDGGPMGVQPLCSMPVCEPHCRLDHMADPCPACVCDRQLRRAFSPVFNVFSDPFCSRLKCGPGCQRAQNKSGPNERCPGCICQGRSGQCAAMQCELPCQFRRFTPDGCPSCVCHTLQMPSLTSLPRI